MQIVYHKSHTSTKMSYFSVFFSRSMQNSWKGWTRDQNIDSYDEISFLGKKAVLIKNENIILKNSDFWYTWSNDLIQQVFQISERSDQYFSRYVWKGIGVTMLFDFLACIMQCCYIQCMIIQCLIFLLQFQFDFITFHFFFLQSCFRTFDICPSSMQDFHCAMRYAILHSTIIHTPSCLYSYFVMPSLRRLW